MTRNRADQLKQSQHGALASLLLVVDRRNALPLHEQIFSGIRARILAGELAPGLRLPSSRKLATDLAVARTTVLQAFDALAAEGYVVMHAASSTRVAPALPIELEARAPRGARSQRTPRLSAVARALASLSAGSPRLSVAPRAFRPGTPALDQFPTALWARISAHCHARASTALLDGGDPLGLPALRAAIATHVSASRGVHCEAEQVFVTAGTQPAFDEILRLFVEPGDQVWVEDPGYLGAHRAIISARARPIAVPVDAQGLDVAAGISRAPRARAVVLAPSHQFPLGVTLSLARRLALVRWAAAERALVIEDDYDSEFRHRGASLTALYGLDTANSVVYVGTFSKSMFPGLRIGFFVAPPTLVDAFAAGRASLPSPASAFEQSALARFLADGHFASHLRRMRLTYRERSEALREALNTDCAGALSPLPCNTGMQLVAQLGIPTTDRAFVAQAARLGVELGALSNYALRARRISGILFGFGGVPVSAIRAGTRILAQVIELMTHR